MQASQFHVTMVNRSARAFGGAYHTNGPCDQLLVERDWDVLQITFTRTDAQSVDWTQDATHDPARVTTTIVGVYAATEVTSDTDVFKLVQDRPEDVQTAGRFLPATGNARVSIRGGTLRLEASVREIKSADQDAPSIIDTGVALLRVGSDRKWHFDAEQEPLMA